MYVVYYRIHHNAAFLYAPQGEECYGAASYGGTNDIAEAARFKTAKQARKAADEYLRMCRANPETSSATVLKVV